MRKLFLLVFTAFAAISVQAQVDYYSSRLNSYTEQLKRATVDLADRTSQDLLRNPSNSRSDIEGAFLAQQLDSTAGLFSEMVRDRRSANELRDAASMLTDLARRAPSYGSYGNYWRTVQNSLNDISRELGGTGGGNTGGDDRPVSGRVYWRGMVDDRVQLSIRGRSIEVRAISGAPYGDGTASFTAGLPTRNVNVDVTKSKGRGSVRVIQQPTRSNDYTAVVEIYDSGSGAKEYQLDIFWR